MNATATDSAPQAASASVPARRDHGFTLIEAMVAMTVIMMVLLAVAAALLSVSKSQQYSEGTDRATQIANDRIERIRQMDWVDIGFYDNTYTTPPGEYGTHAPSGETQVRLGTAPSGTTGCSDNERDDILCPYYLDTSLKNRMKVYTYITYGRDTSLGLPATSSTTPAGGYSFKRVKVVVDWTIPGSSEQKITVNETWFAPEAEDTVPPGVTVTSAP